MPRRASAADHCLLLGEWRTSRLVDACSLYTPRDFDLSRYFAVIKPTIEVGFDYKKINWSADPAPFGK